MKTQLQVAAAFVMLALATRASAATMSASPTAPVANGLDIANYGTVTGTDKWFFENSAAGAAKGQTFKTGTTATLLKSISYQVTSSQQAAPTKGYTIRVGTISGTTFTQIASETATQSFQWNGGAYMTWTFATPVLLAANTTYGIDVGMTSSTSSWQTGIPYLNTTANGYANGAQYSSGTNGLGTATIATAGTDRIFHLDLQHPMKPSPEIGSSVPAGNVALSWSNFTPTTGTDVWVDVWFGTNPAALTQVVSKGLNVNSATVIAPGAATYYWRVDSYLNGTPTGSPTLGDNFTFFVFDSDADGLPDAFELAYTSPSSATSMVPGNDDDTDGLTNFQEFQLGTIPNNPDTDGDSLNDGPELTGVGLRPATDPKKADTDGDGLNDGVETNTATWVSAANTGTNPTIADTDADALTDNVETNTGTFVSKTNTGTSPLNPDTDGDGAGDWYEVTASFTSPLLAAEKPNIPYPLPDPDGSTGAAGKKVRVYIMSGQSNMVGMGTVAGTGDDALETMTLRQNKFPNLVTSSGAWTARQDVYYRGVISATANKALGPGCGADSGKIGPELGFGQIMGWFHDESVLLLKSSIGNRALGWDILPAGSPRYEFGGFTYCGSGDASERWAVGSAAPVWTTGGWYAGYEWDRYFRDESEWIHPHAAETNVVDILDNWNGQYGGSGKPFAGRDFEIAGFVWWQGERDAGDAGHSSRYEQNLVHLINSLRSYYSNRYPGKVVPNAPFVMATLGETALNSPSSSSKTVFDAMMAVDGGSGKYPQFAGNVKTVYSNPLSEGGSGNGHYNNRAGTYMLVGDALGRAMVELESTPPPSSAFASWSAGPFQGTLSNPNASLDFDGGGLATGLEWVVGGDPTKGSDDAAKAPVFDNTTDPNGKFRFIFRRSVAANSDANTAITVEYGSALGGWATATHQGTAANQITISVNPVQPSPGIDEVTVALPASLAGSGKLFARLKVAVTSP